MLSQLIKVTADATGAQKTIAGLGNFTSKAFASVGKEIGSRLASAFAVGAVIDKITGFVKDTVDYADNLGDMADNLGITIEEVQRLQVASSLAGVKFGKMQAILDKIIALQAQAVDGDKKAMEIFSKLGLDPRQANAMQIMEAAIKNQSVAADLFGKRINNVANVVEKLKTLGPIDIITQEQSDLLGKANDQLDEAMRKMKVAAAPAITGALTGAASAMETLNKRGISAAGPFFPGLGGAPLIQQIASAIIEKFQKKPEAIPIAPPIPSTTPMPTPSPISLAAQSDALGRIGLFIGGRGDAGNQLVTIGNYQLTELRRVRSILEEAHR